MHAKISRRQFIQGSALGALALATGRARAVERADAPRICHVMSYDSPWRWTDGQLAGFQEALDLPGASLRVFQMDVKRNSDADAKARVAAAARALIDDWQPDLLYTTDDDALALVARPYVGTAMPIVFSGVNRTLDEHGIDPAPNITGVLEREHFTQSVRLLQTIVPQVRRLAVVGDQGVQWPPVIERIRAGMAQLPGCELTMIEQRADLAGFQAAVNRAQDDADALVQLGIFGLKGADGSNVPYQQVQQWVCEHSRLPDISFWIDRVFHGVLASVTVSEREQGRAAGALARRILVDRMEPASLPVRATVKGHPVINLSRAEQLGLPVRSSVLLGAEVVRGFQWAKSR